MQGESANIMAGNSEQYSPVTARFSALLRGEVKSLEAERAMERATHRLHIAIIVMGAGLYGAAMVGGATRCKRFTPPSNFPHHPVDRRGNAMLNAMLAPLLGLNISFRQSFLAILMSLPIAGAILGSFAPVVAFIIWNSPPMTSTPWESSGPYSFILLTSRRHHRVRGNYPICGCCNYCDTSAAASAAWRFFEFWSRGSRGIFFGTQFRGFCVRSSASLIAGAVSARQRVQRKFLRNHFSDHRLFSSH